VTKRVQFDGDIPEDVRAIIAPYFPLMEVLAPQWCSRLWVRWEPDCETDSCRSCTLTRYEYRYGTVTLHGRWLAQLDADRKETLIHEVLHLYVAPLSGYVRHLAYQLSEDEKLQAVTEEQCREYQESVTQDLTLLVMRLNA
jgi:hypothetical protein